MRKVILILMLVCLAFNGAQLTVQILAHQLHPSQAPLHSLGNQFKGLETVLNNQRTVGYYSDKNMEHPIAIAQYEQAQYVLAPTVLDLNQIHYPFVIIDCSSPEIAFNKVKELGLKLIKASNTGIILASNPKVENLKP